ncbi:caspase, EACC1-associated type [Streptomyces hydrogenans]|uniref:caspase, EACC1-associated type n=1 Tax=Streptomyces hydrogenans TaxID=1873719 RepID=UPI00332CA9B4
MNALPDPATSRAVLIGTSSYDHFEDIPAVSNNLRGLSAFLTSGDGWGLPASHCPVVADPRTSSDIVDAVQKAADEAADTLLVYFAGHGSLDDESRFYLTLGGSVDKQPWTCTAYEWVGKLLSRSRARRRIAIIDSCFSGKVHKRGVMSEESASNVVRSQTAARGTIVLTSARDDRVALAPPGEEYTAFTGELLTVLTEGIPGDPEHISVQRAYEWVKDSLKAKGRPRPDLTGGDTSGFIALARNRSAVGPAAIPGPAVNGSGRHGSFEELLRGLAERVGLRASPSPSEPLGSDLIAGRYRTLSVLGRGGQGTMFRAADTLLDRVVAVKEVGRHRGQERLFDTVGGRHDETGWRGTAWQVELDRTLNEARAVASLNHPGIAAVFDVVERRPMGYIVMEYVDGSDFGRLVREHRTTPEEAVAVTHAVLDSLEHAHESGVIHCDVKPGNVMLSAKGRVKLIDFGIAHREGRPGGLYDETDTGFLIGTLGYMSPEALRGFGPDVARDLYGVGLLFRELLTGTSPLTGGSFFEQANRRMSVAPERPSELAPELGTAFDDFVDRSLAIDPASRFASAAEMKAALLRLAPS